MTRPFQSKKLRFFGKHALNVQEAVEPTNIMWENMDISPSESAKRKVVTKVITFMIILLSVICILASEGVSAALTQSEDCPGRINTMITNTANHTEVVISVPIANEWIKNRT